MTPGLSHRERVKIARATPRTSLIAFEDASTAHQMTLALTSKTHPIKRVLPVSARVYRIP